MAGLTYPRKDLQTTKREDVERERPRERELFGREGEAEKEALQ